MFLFRYYGRATSVLDGLFTLMLEGATRQLVARDKVLRLVEAVKWDTPYVSDKRTSSTRLGLATKCEFPPTHTHTLKHH